MKTIRWGHFCEDDAFRWFVEEALHQIVRYHGIPCELEQDKEYKKFKPGGKLQVVNQSRAATTTALNSGLDLCLIGVDLDEDNCAELVSRIEKKITENARNISLIVVAVKEIEYWLWYLKYFAEGTTVEPGKLEDYPRKGDYKGKLSVKRLVYGINKGHIGTEKQGPIVKELTVALDVERLKEHSQSFAYFVREVGNYIAL